MTEQVVTDYTIEYRINDSKMADNRRQVKVPVSPAELDELVEQGFLLCRDLFPSEMLDRMRVAVDRLEAIEGEHPQGERLPGNGFYLRFLRDKDEVFRDLLFYSPPVSIARALLGPQVWFDVDARIAYADSPGKFVPWHIHKRVVPSPMPPFFSYPHGIHCLLYLDDVGDAEGPLVVLPGSHRRNDLELPDGDTRDLPGQQLVRPRAGDCLIVHANLWHRTMPTLPGCHRRRLVLIGYEPAWSKSAITRGIKPEHPLTENLRGSGDPELSELLDEWHW
jgi:hypothetical protein